MAHFAATGQAPTDLLNDIAPHPYLDPLGQRRMSDTNEPERIPPPDGQFWDNDNNLRYTATGDPVEEAEPQPQPATDGAGARQGGGSDDGKVTGSVDRISFDYSLELLLSDGTLVKVEGDAELLDDDRILAFNVEQSQSAAGELLRFLHREAKLLIDEGAELLTGGPAKSGAGRASDRAV